MPDWQKAHRGWSLLTMMAWYVTLMGCGNNGVSNDDRRGGRQAEAERAVKLQDAEGARPAEANQSGTVRKLTTGKCTRIGNFREANEDAIAIEELSGSTLCLAADGMGGEVGKRVPGRIACERAFEVLKRELKKNLSHAATPEENRKVLCSVPTRC